MPRALLIASILSLASLALSGCATVEGWFSKGSSALQAATTLAVGEAVLSAKTPAAEAAMAASIISITNKVSADVTTGVTVANLVGVAQAEVAKLGNPQEVLAGETLLAALQPILTQYVGAGLLDPTAVTDVKLFCSWVVAAATPYANVGLRKHPV